MCHTPAVCTSTSDTPLRCVSVPADAPYAPNHVSLVLKARQMYVPSSFRGLQRVEVRHLVLAADDGLQLHNLLQRVGSPSCRNDLQRNVDLLLPVVRSFGTMIHIVWGDGATYPSTDILLLFSSCPRRERSSD